MAKYTKEIIGNFDEVLDFCENEIQNRSKTATFEDGDDMRIGDVKFAFRVYERYSAVGSSRVSLSFTLAGEKDQLRLTAIASGGSQAVLHKINRWGEENFLETLAEAIESRYPA